MHHSLITVETPSSEEVNLQLLFETIQTLKNSCKITNEITGERKCIVVSFIGRQKTYKSTHANTIFKTNFPVGEFMRVQTTMGVYCELVELTGENGQIVNLLCLDYEGFGSTSRPNISADIEKQLNSKLMLLAYVVSDIVIYSQKNDISSLREYTNLLSTVISNEHSKKPILYLFENFELSDTTSYFKMFNEPDNSTFRSKLNDIATESIVQNQQVIECFTNYFSTFYLEVLFPKINSLPISTNEYAIQEVTNKLMYDIFRLDGNESELLMDENYWINIIESINQNSSIEFLSDSLGRVSEKICKDLLNQLTNECETMLMNLTRVDSIEPLLKEMIEKYRSSARGRYATPILEKLQRDLQDLNDHYYSMIKEKEVNQVFDSFEREICYLLENRTFSFTAQVDELLINYSKQVESHLLDAKLTKLMSNHIEKQMKQTSQAIDEMIKLNTNNHAEMLQKLQEQRTQFKYFSTKIEIEELVADWNENLTRKIEIEREKYEKSKQPNEIRSRMYEIQKEFLVSSRKVESLKDMDLIRKLTQLEWDNLLYETQDEMNRNEITLRKEKLDEEYQSAVNHFIDEELSKIEQEFTEKLENIQTKSELTSIHKQFLQKYSPYNKFDQSSRSKERLNSIYEKTLQQFDPTVLFNKGKELYYGNGSVKVNRNQAFHYLKLAADQDHGEALYMIGDMYYYGTDTTLDYNSAANYFKKAYSVIHVKGMFKYARMFQLGQGGLTPNKETAIVILLEALKQPFKDFTNFDFSNMDLSDLKLENMNLTCANFKNCILKKTSFSGSSLSNADFTNCVLLNNNLSNRSDTRNLKFTNCKLEGVDFSKSNLMECDFSGVKECKGCEFTDAQLSGPYAHFMSQLMPTLDIYKGLCSLSGCKSGLQLIYRASRDGFKASDFHSKCDNMGATLTVVKSEHGHIFGGFTSLSWKPSSGEYFNDSSAFIFKIENSIIRKFRPTQYTQYSVYFHSNYLPTFGGGHDFHLSSDCNVNTSSYSNFSFTYELPTGLTNGSAYLAGTYNFRVLEIEVFKIN